MRPQSNGKLKKVVKSVRGKHGTVRRTYYVKASPDQKKGIRQEGAKGPGFLRRHAGKLVAGAAIAGLALANRHKLTGAGRNAVSSWKNAEAGTGAVARAKESFRMAKLGYSANRGMDRIDVHTRRLGRATQGLRDKATTWRRNTGSELASHLGHVGGEAAAHHLGSRFGQVAGTAIGGMVAGPVGAGIGGFVGGHAGGFLAGKHSAPHIARGANWLAERMRR